MRNLIIAAAMLAAWSTAAGAAWETKVIEISGIRSISMTGLEGGYGRGISITCTGMDLGVTPVFFVSTTPWRDFSILAGEPAEIFVGPLSFNGIIVQNDSIATLLQAAAPDFSGLLNSLGESDHVDIGISSGDQHDEMAISVDGLAIALGEFRAACGL